MRTIAVLSPKGGVGKTTLALNIAGGYAARGLRVIVQDLDPQGSALAWAAIAAARGATTSYPVVRALAVSQRCDVLVLDCPPGSVPREALQAQVVVVPTTPDAASHFAVAAARKALSQRQVVHLVLNRFRSDRAEHRDLAATDDYRTAVQVRDRAAFAAAFGRGQTIYDAKPGHIGFTLARQDIHDILEAIR